MTDKTIDNTKEMNIEQVPLAGAIGIDGFDMDGELSVQDEQLLQSFFSDCKTLVIPDDGFSERVMAALPSAEMEKAMVKRRRLEHLWTVVCVGIGIVAAVTCQGWEQIQAFFFSLKIDFLLSGSHALTQVADALGRSQNLWMMLAGIIVLGMVWGYNVVLDAKQRA